VVAKPAHLPTAVPRCQFFRAASSPRGMTRRIGLPVRAPKATGEGRNRNDSGPKAR